MKRTLIGWFFLALFLAGVAGWLVYIAASIPDKPLEFPKAIMDYEGEQYIILDEFAISEYHTGALPR
jgi:hypothetical protein